ncbi:thioesterase II family protein [Streptomyces sp. NPDC017993]|uniref:thioesterase II family protein n=1 Tax=Streptomyces sp. NPDC017993 TaxID=3365027 RepID=UPI0037BDAA46
MSPALTRPRRFGSAWLKWYRPVLAPRLRLICLPYAGGTAGAFHSWADRLPANVELVAVQYPGRQDRFQEPCVEEMAPLADHIAQELAPYCDRPFALFGHSMGAAVGYEVALRLEARYGARPQHLFVSGHASPLLPRGHRDVHLRDEESMLEWFGELGAMDPAVLADKELRPLVVPSLRADLRLIETYRPAPHRPVSAPLTSYVGDADPGVDPDDAAAWSELTSGEFSFRVFPGGHFYLSDQETELLADITERLEGAPA